MTHTILLAAGIAVLFVLTLILYLVRKPATHQVDNSTSLNERMFQPVLEKVVGGQYEVFPKVTLCEVLEPVKTLSNRAQRKVFQSLQERQFDFVVVDKATNSIICAVELDEHKFDKKMYKKQDLFLEDICVKVGLPLLRVPSQRGYNLSELIERFERIIEPSIVNAQIVSSAETDLKVRPQFEPAEGRTCAE
ncbi:MAG: DUF2726 domain-containing protein [Neptuniibacter sp.]